MSASHIHHWAMPVGNLNEQKIVRLARAMLDAMDRGTDEVFIPQWPRRVNHLSFGSVWVELEVHPGSAAAVTMTAFEDGHMIGEVQRETFGPVAHLGQKVALVLDEREALRGETSRTGRRRLFTPAARELGE